MGRGLTNNFNGVYGGTGGTGTTPPSDVTGLQVSGFIDPLSGAITLTVSVTPPSGDFDGCHLYLEVPDQSGAASSTVGTAVVGGSAPAGGSWYPIDLGVQPYVASQQPFVLTAPGPPSLDSTVDTPCRLYVASVVAEVDNALVRAGQPGATPNQTFSLVSLGSGTPTAGTNVTDTCGAIAASVLPDDNSTGKLRTPVIVMVSSVPANIPNWTCRLVLTWAGVDPTVLANQQTVGNAFNTAGPVYGSPDGIPIPHSFALDTPKEVKHAIIWAQSGTSQAGGRGAGTLKRGRWNNIVPGITPSFPITIGTTTGTTDAASVMAASVAASMAVVGGLFGVAAQGITNPLLGNQAVATLNIDNLAITNPLMASLAVQAANMASGSVTAGNAALASLAVGTAALQSACVTYGIIANLAVSSAQIQNATITGLQVAYATIAGANIGLATIAQGNMANLSVGTAQIQDLAVTSAKIQSLSAGKLTADVVNVLLTLNAAQATFTANGVTSYFGQMYDGVLDGYAGLTVTNVATGAYSLVWPHGFCTRSDGTLSPMTAAIGLGGLGTPHPTLTLSVSLGVGITLDSNLGGTHPAISMNGNQVVRERQTGPGTPSFASLSDAQTWCQNLYNALKPTGHGLVT